MRLELSSEGRYALRALLYLTVEEERVSATKISSGAKVPPRLLARILADLARAGLVASKAGRGGGAMLARSPSTITLRDVVDAVEGPFAVSTCILENRTCGGESTCVMHEAWVVAQNAFLHELERRTLLDLVSPGADMDPRPVEHG